MNQLLNVRSIAIQWLAGILSSFVIASSVTAQQAATDSPTLDLQQAIAKEAYIYGFPLVENYKTMYAYAVAKDRDQYKAPFNTLHNEANVFTPDDTAIVTPNSDTPYSFLWMDLRAEPLVLGVPEIDQQRYYSIQLIDFYTYNFDYVGSRATGNDAANYMIAGPNWQGEKPDEIDKLIRCETEFALAIFRTQLFGPDDLDNVKQVQSQYSVQTWSDFRSTPAPEDADAIDFPTVESDSDDALDFFAQLDFVLDFCPSHSSEQELRSRLASIGIGDEQVFDASSLSEEMKTALASGVAEGVAAIAAAVPTARPAMMFGTREFLGNDYLKRAVGARIGLYGNSKEEALYPLYRTDAEGQPLDASKENYVLKFPADSMPPVNAFWSVTIYDGKTQSLVANPIDRYLINSTMVPELTRDPDDGLSLYIQHQSPGDDQESNWLPSPDGTFYLVMRLYWPKPAAYDGSWTVPLVRSANSTPGKTLSPEGAEALQEVKPAVLDNEPQPELERPTVWGEPTEVQIGIYIIDIDEVSTAQQSFAASVYYEARWNNPLLKHPGPGPLHRGVTEVWTPRLTIIGQQNVWPSFRESVEIQPDGEVIYRHKAWGNFSQPLDLRAFPMDQQTLNIHVIATGLFEKHVKMVPLVKNGVRVSDVAKTFSVPDFEVQSWKGEPKPYYAHKDSAGTAGFQIEITMKRKVTYYVLKIIVPLTLIVIMSWLPRWIDPEQIGTNIGISTTAFLTLVAYLFAITVLLPRVSYVTRMDRFILLSTLLVFGALIQTVATSGLIRREKKLLAERIDRYSRLVYPLLLLTVLALSFLGPV